MNKNGEHFNFAGNQRGVIMKENLDRILHGWFPRQDAHWFWWVVADIIVLVSIMKLVVMDKLRARRKV